MELHVQILLMLKVSILSASFNLVFGQQSPDYFDFWKEGKWESEITIFNKDTIPEKDSFFVHKLKNKNAFTEEWKIFIGEGEYVDAFTIRAYDEETKRWKLFYVDDLNAQTWDSVVIGDRIYFTKSFRYNGNLFYSRQAWSLRADGRVLRTIERSKDQKNWQMRYWQLFRGVD